MVQCSKSKFMGFNNKVIYPDEAFIVAKRTSGDVTFSFEGTVQTSDQKIFLPGGDNQVLMNNPYGTDLLLGELSHLSQ